MFYSNHISVALEFTDSKMLVQNPSLFIMDLESFLEFSNFSFYGIIPSVQTQIHINGLWPNFVQEPTG